ncbi:MAG TPA: ActS/PrrB/RegB family redox-sensitive histidine kinase [Alphaproteobacteria bacterium]|nr:ActS/PrrB/RegB family redox-sensitive histidine kinase [Alphaproteobacteria bacterium]
MLAGWLNPWSESARASLGTPVRLRTLVIIRWIAVLGQAITLFVVHFGFGFELPLNPTLAAIGASAVLNLVLTLYRPAARLGDRGAAILLAWDLLQLAVLLYFTGGLTNPFALLLLAPIAISATALSRFSTIALVGLGMICVSVLAAWFEPLPWPGGGLEFPWLYVAGLWAALGVGMLFIAIYLGRVTGEARRMSDALAASQAALEREQRLSAVGGLAAAAAHELGTPLGTIAVVAREIARDLPKDSPLAEDAAILLAETARCRDILARLAARPETDGGAPFSRLPISALIESAAAPHRREPVQIAVSVRGADGTEEPQVKRQPEIVHGLGTLIENAVQFAASRVEVNAIWDKDRIELSVVDDGPGFSIAVLDRLGEPYISTRNAEGEHMGLGVFIASTLLARTGAKLEFSNRPEGGASVRVRWPRARIASAVKVPEAAQ